MPGESTDARVEETRLARAFVNALWVICRASADEDQRSSVDDALAAVLSPEEVEAVYAPADPPGLPEPTGARGPRLDSFVMQALRDVSDQTWGGSEQENFYAGSLSIRGTKVIWQWDWGTVQWWGEGDPGFEMAGQLSNSDPWA